MPIRPPLSKKSFPVCVCGGGGGDMKKKSHSALFSPLGRWTGNNFLYKGGLMTPWVTYWYASSASLHVMVASPPPFPFFPPFFFFPLPLFFLPFFPILTELV